MVTFRYAILWGLIGWLFELVVWGPLMLIAGLIASQGNILAAHALASMSIPILLGVLGVGLATGTEYCMKGGCENPIPEYLLIVGLLLPFFVAGALIGIWRGVAAGLSSSPQ